MKLSKALQVVCWLVRICKSKGLLPLEVNDVGTPTVFNTLDMFEMFIHVLLCNFLRETQLAWLRSSVKEVTRNSASVCSTKTWKNHRWDLRLLGNNLASSHLVALLGTRNKQVMPVFALGILMLRGMEKHFYWKRLVCTWQESPLHQMDAQRLMMQQRSRVQGSHFKEKRVNLRWRKLFSTRLET